MSILGAVLGAIIRAITLPIIFMWTGATWAWKRQAERNAKIKGKQLDIAARYRRSRADILERLHRREL